MAGMDPLRFERLVNEGWKDLFISNGIRRDIQYKDIHIDLQKMGYPASQTTMGTPQTIYFGGLLRAVVRYYDIENNRPGLPSEVSAWLKVSRQIKGC